MEVEEAVVATEEVATEADMVAAIEVVATGSSAQKNANVQPRDCGVVA